MRLKKIIYLKIIGILILIWLFWRIDIGETAEILFQTRIFLIFCAGILMLLQVFIKFLRYQYILIQQKISSPLHQTIHFSLAAIYLSFITPGRIGEVSKAWFIHKAEGAPLNKLIAGGILDRCFDVYALLFIALTSLALMNPYGKNSYTIIAALILAALSPLFIIVKPAQKMGIQILEKLQHKITILKNWPRQLEEFFTEIDSLLNRRLFFEGAATLIAYAVFFASCYLISRSLDIPLSYLKIAAFIACANILSFLPISFAGIGTREISLVFFFSQENLASESALAFSALVFLLTYLLFGLIGFLCFITLKSGQADRFIDTERKG